MEVSTEHADQRTRLEEKIRSLDAEKASLLGGIASVKERIAILRLEKSARELESEVQALRTEKANLEQKAASLEAETGHLTQPAASG